MKLFDTKSMYRDMAKGMGRQVTCPICGRIEDVDPEHCLKHGWPMCCGHTMHLGGKR